MAGNNYRYLVAGHAIANGSIGPRRTCPDGQLSVTKHGSNRNFAALTNYSALKDTQTIKIELDIAKIIFTSALCISLKPAQQRRFLA